MCETVVGMLDLAFETDMKQQAFIWDCFFVSVQFVMHAA